MYRIAVLSDHQQTGQKIVDQVTQFCAENGLFPQVDLHSDQENFFNNIFQTKPTSVILSLSGVSGLNAAEHLRALLPTCGLIWCSDLDFSLHAYRLRADYFILMPVTETELKNGLSVWMKQRTKNTNI